MEKLDTDLMSGEFILCFVNSEYREFPVFAVLIRKRQQNSEDKGFFEFEIAGIDIGFKIKLFDDLLDFFFSLSCYSAPVVDYAVNGTDRDPCPVCYFRNGCYGDG